MTTSKRLWGLDLFKLGAACLVILLHTVPNAQVDHFLNIVASHDEPVRPFLICSGFLWAMAAHRREVDRPLDYYRTLFPRWLAQILIPYTILYGFEVLYHSFFVTWNNLNTWYYPFLNGDPRGFFRIREMAAMFLTGGPGPGGYYIGLLVQLLILFPLFRWFYAKFPWPCFILTILCMYKLGALIPIWQHFEAIIEVTGSRAIGLDRLLTFLLGMATFQVGIKWQWYHSALFAAAGWLIRGRSFGLSLLLIMEALLLAGICISRVSLPSFTAGLLGHLGKASYFIFLFQKAYCATGVTHFLFLYVRDPEWIPPILCLLGGILYYALYSLGKAILLRIIKRLKRQPQPVA